MLNTQFSPWPSYTEEEAEAVRQVILSNRVNYWTGDECRKFELEFASWCEAKYAVSLANGTVALDLAIKILEIGRGDEVIVTPRTYIASVSSIINAGAKPIFADIDRDSQNITAASIEAVYTQKTKAIICVHLGGWPCEMDGILEFAKAKNIKVIEDCAQAHGAKYKGKPVGSLGDVGTWSFCQDKIMTTGGEGGMLTTNNLELWHRAWSYKDHGKSWDAVYNKTHRPGFRWVHDSFGTNWRMTEIQAAIGRIQIRRMPEWHKKRTDNARSILKSTEGVAGLRSPKLPNHIEHAFYRAYIFLCPNKLKKDWNKNKIIAEIQRSGVPCGEGSCAEVYLEKSFLQTEYRPKFRLQNAKELGETSLMFLTHPTLTENEIEKTNKILKYVMQNALL